MIRSVVVVGAGGFGREVLDVIDAINVAQSAPRWQVDGVVDDHPSADNLQRLEVRHITYLGSVEHHLASDSRAAYIIGIGSPQTRRTIAHRFGAAGREPATLVHPSASRGLEVTTGAGTVICAGVRVTTNIQIGRHVHLNPNVTIGHDSVIGDFVSINPQGAISGDCVIEEGALIGVSGVVLNGLRVGAGAVVGGCACVVRDVEPGVVVKGVPAR